MISVCININGKFIMGRSARRVQDYDGGICVYKCDDGTFIYHNPDNGAVELAVKMLETIKEDR